MADPPVMFVKAEDFIINVFVMDELLATLMSLNLIAELLEMFWKVHPKIFIFSV